MLNFFIFAALIHCSLFFFNVIFKSCLHYPYFLLMESIGLEIKTMRIECRTTAFNRKIHKLACNYSKFWALWFDIGVLVSIILLPIATLLVVKMTFVSLSAQPASMDSISTWNLEPMIPGINIPMSHIHYYIGTLGICFIIHELGHAIAASLENVQLFHVGLILAFILPISFVSIDSEQIRFLRMKNKLRILCAGIWHNVVLAVFATFILYLIPWICFPLYLSNTGVYVKSMSTNSPLLGPNGIENKDIIHKINDCRVNNNDDWYHCILQSVKQPTPGYCVIQSFIKEHDESIHPVVQNGVLDCCEKNKDSNNKLCFEYVEDSTSEQMKFPSYTCLPARNVIEQSIRYCYSTLHCERPKSLCVKPLLDNATKIVQISRRDGRDVLFLGHPQEIYRSIEISNWIPKYAVLTPTIPESMELLCKYMIVLSSGLAVINVVPCFFFDGQYIVKVLSQDLLRSIIRNKSVRDSIPFTLASVGSILLIINVVHIFLTLF